MSKINQKITKISIGIQPAIRVFRVNDLRGSIIDNLINMGGNNLISDPYFSELITSPSEDGFIVRNEINTHALTVKFDNIIFTHSFNNSVIYNKDSFQSDFIAAWSIIDDILDVSNIRRLGIVAEWHHESASKNISKLLLKKLTTLDTGNFPAKFKLHYEGRRPTKEKVAPDIKKDDLTNTIFEISEDIRSIAGRDMAVIHLTIDTQRYFTPPLKAGSRVPKEVSKLFSIFESNAKKAHDNLRNFEIISV